MSSTYALYSILEMPRHTSQPMLRGGGEEAKILSPNFHPSERLLSTSSFVPINDDNTADTTAPPPFKMSSNQEEKREQHRINIGMIRETLLHEICFKS